MMGTILYFGYGDGELPSEIEDLHTILRAYNYSDGLELFNAHRTSIDAAVLAYRAKDQANNGFHCMGLFNIIKKEDIPAAFYSEWPYEIKDRLNAISNIRDYPILSLSQSSELIDWISKQIPQS